MAKKYINSIKFSNGIFLNAGKPIDDRFVVENVSDLYITNANRSEAIYDQKAYDGMLVVVMNNNKPYACILNDCTPYLFNATQEVTADNFHTYWTEVGKVMTDYITNTVDVSINSLESRMSKADSSISTLNSSVNTIETRLGKADTSIGTLNSSVSGLETHISKTDTSIATLNSSVNGLDTSIKNFETRWTEREQSLTTILNTINSSISSLNSSVNDHQNHFVNTDASINILDNSVNKLDASLNALNSSYVNLVDELIEDEYVIAAALGDLNDKVGATRVVDAPESDSDLDIADDNMNVLARFANGHIQTKYFDSSAVVATLDEIVNGEVGGIGGIEIMDGVEDSDLDIADPSANVIMRLAQGHIQTKYFDSSAIVSDIANLSDAVEDVNIAIDYLDSSLENLRNEIYGGAAQTLDLDVIDSDDSDFDIADSSGNVIMRLNEGGIRTKFFDSSSVNTSISSLEDDVVRLEGLINEIDGVEGVIDYSDRLNTIDGSISEHLEAIEDINSSIDNINSSLNYVYEQGFGGAGIDEETLNSLPQIIDSEDESSDLDFADSSGNVILRLSNGGIQTKNFNSTNLFVDTTSIFEGLLGGEVDFDYESLLNSTLICKYTEDGHNCTLNVKMVPVYNDSDIVLYYEVFNPADDGEFVKKYVRISKVNNNKVSIVKKSL